MLAALPRAGQGRFQQPRLQAGGRRRLARPKQRHRGHPVAAGGANASLNSERQNQRYTAHPATGNLHPAYTTCTCHPTAYSMCYSQHESATMRHSAARTHLIGRRSAVVVAAHLVAADAGAAARAAVIRHPRVGHAAAALPPVPTVRPPKMPSQRLPLRVLPSAPGTPVRAPRVPEARSRGKAGSPVAVVAIVHVAAITRGAARATAGRRHHEQQQHKAH